MSWHLPCLFRKTENYLLKIVEPLYISFNDHTSSVSITFTFLSLHQSKKRFEREWREAERAAQYAEKTDQDINATKADVEKVTMGEKKAVFQ